MNNNKRTISKNYYCQCLQNLIYHLRTSERCCRCAAVSCLEKILFLRPGCWGGATLPQMMMMVSSFSSIYPAIDGMKLRSEGVQYRFVWRRHWQNEKSPTNDQWSISKQFWQRRDDDQANGEWSAVAVLNIINYESLFAWSILVSHDCSISPEVTASPLLNPIVIHIPRH